MSVVLRVLPFVVAALGAAVVLTAGGRVLGLGWAFQYLSYLSPVLRGVLAALILAAAVPWRTPAFLRAPRFRLPWWLPVPVSLPVFWLLRERTRHGDAEFKVWLLSHESLRTDPFVWKEPLDSVIAYTLTGLLAPYGFRPDAAVALASVAAGGVYVLAVLLAVRALARGTAQAWVMGAALFALGSSQLWFGHVENYSLVTAFTALTLALAVRHVAARDVSPKSKRAAPPLWPIGLAGGVAVSFHPQAAFAMPALLVLPRRGRRVKDLLVLLAGGLAPILATAALLRALGAPWPELAGGYARDQQLFWTPAQAVAHLGGAVQNLWLLVPAWPLWVLAGGLVWFHPSSRRSTLARYLAAVAVGLLVYHLSFQNDLARNKDWDLYAIVGPPLALWGVHAWLGWMDRAVVPARASLARVLAVGLVFAAVLAAAWIGVNARYRVLM